MSLRLVLSAETIGDLGGLVADFRAQQDAQIESPNRKRGLSAELSFLYKWKKLATNDIAWSIDEPALALASKGSEPIERLSFQCSMEGRSVVLLTSGNGFLGIVRCSANVSISEGGLRIPASISA
jgi:hypothetical protein